MSEQLQPKNNHENEDDFGFWYYVKEVIKEFTFNEIISECHEYSVLRVIPHKRGYGANDFNKIMNLISNYKTGLMERLEIRGDTLVYHPPQPMCYEILFTKEKIEFYFVVPHIYKTVFANKLKYVLKHCDIIEANDYIDNFKESYKYEIKPQDDWLFSINSETNTNLTDSLLVLHKDIVNTDDSILVQHMFQPLFDYQWKDKWHKKYNKYKSTGVKQKKNGLLKILDILEHSTDFILMQIDLILNAIMLAISGDTPLQIEPPSYNHINELQNSTKKKAIHDGFGYESNVYIKTQNGNLKQNIARNVNTILKDLEGDNKLTLGRCKTIQKEKDLQRKVFKKNCINTLEGRQLIYTPSESAMRMFEDYIDIINVEVAELPKELYKENGIVLGEMKVGDRYRILTQGLDADSLSKPIIYLSPQEGGKSSFIRRYGISALEQGHSIFAFDTIDGKTISYIRDYLPSNFPEEKIIILDFNNNEYIFELMWNEIADKYMMQLHSTNNPAKRYQLLEQFSMEMGEEFKRFINIFNDSDSKLSANMEDALKSLAQLVFMNGGNFGMIQDCVYNQELRHKLLNNLQLPPTVPFVQEILKLDDETGSSKTLSAISSRLKRIMSSDLKKYFSIEDGIKLPFDKWANEGYCVLMNIPKHKADVLVTFLSQKLWLACTSSRYNMKEEDRPHVHLLIDEPNEYPNVMNLLKDTIIASRKWHLRFVFCVHNMEIFGKMLSNLLNAGVSIIAIPTSYKNFRTIEHFFNPYTYETLNVEVGKLIAKYNGRYRFALTSYHYKNANYPCIIRLPLPVEMCYKKIDRSYLTEECCKKYGTEQLKYYEDLLNTNNKELVPPQENIDYEDVTL